MAMTKTKMHWYSFAWDDSVEKPYVSDTDDLKGFHESQLTSGAEIVGWDDRAWIRCTDPEYDGQPADALASHLGVEIYSLRLRQALDKSGMRGIQYLPIRVLRRDGPEISGYQIANFLNKVRALDLERSEYNRYKDDYFIPERRGRISMLKKVVLKSKALENFDVIRLEEYFTYKAVSERFKKAFEAAHCTGYVFYEIDVSR